jgi:uncharacterized protein YjbJ (UPF0337 family)
MPCRRWHVVVSRLPDFMREQIHMTRTPQNTKHSTADGLGESIKGKATEAKGKIEDAAGALTGNLKTQAKGKLDQAKGKAEDAIGKAERSANEKA